MIEIIKEKKGVFIVGLIIVLLAITYIIKSNSSDTNIENQEVLIKDNVEDDKIKEEAIVIVHIAGAVKSPGIVKLKEGSRVEDAIKEAGGLLDDADISNINLAYIVEDGTKIKIPSSSEKDETNEINSENYITDSIGNDIQNTGKRKVININTASQTDFETLEGIGSSLANKIIEYRNKNGKFKSIDDLKNISGIGESKFEKIKDYIKV